MLTIKHLLVEKATRKPKKGAKNRRDSAGLTIQAAVQVPVLDTMQVTVREAVLDTIQEAVLNTRQVALHEFEQPLLLQVFTAPQ